MNSLLHAKTNVLGAFLIALVSSISTVVISNWMNTAQSENFAVAGNPLARFQTSSRAVLECGEKVYSPVQNQCVAQTVFDDEMRRLYAALGIETAAFERVPTDSRN